MNLFEEIDKVTKIYRTLLYVRASCESLVKPEDLARHKETCKACVEGYSIFDWPESEERYLDDPRHTPYSNPRRKP